MDSWASDGFYSHFPSYSQQPSRREALAKARQLEYQTFLSRVSPRKGKIDGKAQKRHTTNESQCKRPKIPTNDTMQKNELPKLDTKHTADDNNGESDSSSRVEVKNKFLDELENMDLPDIFNEQSINERNQKSKEDKRLRNIQYQQELMQQIEQKRREREIQRAKEQQEEDRLTKRMEEQLKMVRLHDELESQRQTRHREKSRINLDSNRPIVAQQPTKPSITVRSEQIEPNACTYRSYDERKAHTDRGKENCDEPKRNDKEIYNFFTNSAQNQLKDTRYSHYFDLEDLSENEILPNSLSSSTYNTYPSKSTRRQDAAQKRQNDPIKQAMCNFCKHNRFLARNQEENIANGLICGSCESEPICLSCRKEICTRCKRPTNNDEHALKAPQRHLKQRNTDTEFIVTKDQEPQAKPKYVRLESFRPIYTDEDDSLSDLSSSDHKPYSFNIDESSVFHPAKSRLNRKLSVSIRNGEIFVQPDSFDELKRITEEKLKKYAKNYGDFRYKRPVDGKEERVQDIRIPVPMLANAKPKLNLDPMPAMRDNTKKLIEFAKELERGDKNIFKRIEAKHQVPAVQTNKVVQNNDITSTLTQVGAFKKQLLLDKLNF
ncbi:inner centromere protein A [Sitodiplosis mosellana]|uniref:inner centromere protein A n=1 Tax=Sitodiplosis mosellana TaxID=263140 RepID=UPI002443D2C0|nr:inner centromere protein A [Sitodiplosis mosellana]